MLEAEFLAPSDLGSSNSLLRMPFLLCAVRDANSQFNDHFKIGCDFVNTHFCEDLKNTFGRKHLF